MKKHYAVLLGALLIQMTAGSIYTWSLYANYWQENLGVSLSETALTFSILIFTFALTTLISGPFLDHYGPRKSAWIGLVLFSSGYLLTRYINHIYLLYLTQGFMLGLGVGFIYLVPIATLSKWFKTQKGLITGLAVAAFGLGALIYKPIILYLLEHYSILDTYTYMGFIYLIVLFVGALFIENPKEVHVMVDHTKWHIKDKSFYALFLSYFIATSIGLFILGNLKSISIQLGFSEVDAINLVAILSLSNALGRLLFGSISDYLHPLNTIRILFILSIVGLVFLHLNHAIYSYLGLFLISSSFGGFLAVYPIETKNKYGEMSFGKHYGILYQAYGLSAFVGPLLILMNLYIALWVLAILACIGLVVLQYQPKK